MKELWLLRGRTPVLWTIPFWVDWVESDRAHIEPAHPLSEKQIRDISNTIEELPVKSLEFGKWAMHRRYLERLANPLPPGTTPDSVFSWHRPHPADDPKNQTNENVDVNEFVATLFLRGVGKSREEVYWWYSQFCNHMADTLLNQEKPVDLMFVKLHMVPYRRNYIYVLMSRFPKIAQGLGHSQSEARDLRCHLSGFYEEMLSLDLLAMNQREGYCYRYVEVEHTPKWFRTIRTIERARLSLLGQAKYAACLLGQLRDRVKASVHLYTLWAADIARPCATDVECGYTGELRLVPHKPPVPHPNAGVRPYYVPVVVSNKLPLFKPSSPMDYLCEANTEMCDLPDVQPASPDVRNGRGKLLQPNHKAK